MTKFVYPYGRSFTQEIRQLWLKKSKDENTSRVTFKEFLTQNPEALIAVHISVIDKIFRKPVSGLASIKLYETRSKIGVRVWELLETRIRHNGYKPEEYKKTFEWKLHPYLEKPKKRKKGHENFQKRDGYEFKKGKPGEKFEGRYYNAFCNTITLNEIEHKSLAKSIEDHLFVCARAINPDSKSGTFNKGYIDHVIDSVEKSIPHKNINIADQIWDKDDENSYFSRFNVAEALIDCAKECERVDTNNRKFQSRLNSKHVGQIFFDGYAKVFIGDNNAVLKRNDIPENMQGLLALHDAIKAYYTRVVKTSKKGTKKEGKYLGKLSFILPKNNEELLVRLNQINANKDVNAMIRLGRLVHYSSANSPDHKVNSEQFKFYQTSAGQAEIKRNEAFVRVWRSSISLAARTIRSLVDSHGKIGFTEEQIVKAKAEGTLLDFDITSGKYRQINNEQFSLMFNADHSASKLALIFGRAAKKMPNSDNITELQALMRLTLGVLALARNNSFHFKTRASFVSELKKSFEKVCNEKKQIQKYLFEKLENLLATDRAERISRFKSTLKAIHLNKFGTKPQVDAIWNELSKHADSDLVLPKLHNVLGHMQNVQQTSSFGDIKLPPKYNSSKLEIPALLCQYSTLKLLYDGPFKLFLEDKTKVDTNNLKALCLEILKLGDERARAANKNKAHKEFIFSKAAKLPLPTTGENLWSYFHKLDAIMATEMRVQSGYEPNKEAAKQKSEFIVNFQRELICSLFLNYISDNEFEWITKLSEQDKLRENEVEFPEIDETETEYEDWESLLYFFFHFIPNDDLSLLLHQFKKWRVLSQSEKSLIQEDKTALDDEARLRNLMTLCIDMQSDKFDGEPVDANYDIIREKLFESTEGFDKVFADDGSIMLSTRKGLRQILRYGHLEALLNEFQVAKVTDQQIKDYFKQSEQRPKQKYSPIAFSQEKRRKLHEDAIKKPGDFSRDDFEVYKKLTNEIVSFRTLAAQVRLTNIVKAHNILIRVLARMIDFAAGWERDQYFILLALCYSENPSNSVTEIIEPNTPSNMVSRIVNGQPKLEYIKDEYKEKLFSLIKNANSKQAHFSRNNLAHFNVIDRDQDIDLTSLINDLRELLSYDRKQKNVISKSISDIMVKEGFELSWKTNKNHNLEKAFLKSKIIPHFSSTRFRKLDNGDRITEFANTADLMNMVRKFFDAKPPQNNHRNKKRRESK